MAGESKSTVLIATISAVSAIVIAAITTYGMIYASAGQVRRDLEYSSTEANRVKTNLKETSERQVKAEEEISDVQLKADSLNQKLQEIYRRADFLVIRPGTILPFGGVADLDDPKGYIPCDGRQVKREKYADLFAAIGTAWGQGDGSTTFNVPDLRGYFLRGTDAAARRDPDVQARTASRKGGNTGDNVGSVQSDEFGKHTHTGPGQHLHYWRGWRSVEPDGRRCRSDNWIESDPEVEINRRDAHGGDDGKHNHGPQGGNETRPKNAYVNFIIRY